MLGTRQEEDDRGFSLIELLYVILIVAIVAALAIPNLLTSKKAAYEASTISYLRSLSTAQELYKNQSGEFAGDFGSLASNNLIQLPEPEVLGYVVTLSSDGGQVSWSASASPVDAGVTGDRHFYVDQTGVIRESNSGAAGPTSPPVVSSD